MSGKNKLRIARVELLGSIECLDDARLRRQTMRAAVQDYGGTLIEPQTQSSWGPQQAQLSLLQVSGFGGDVDAAMADWCAAAHRMEIAFQAEEAAA